MPFCKHCGVTALFLVALSFPLFCSHAEEPMATQPEESIFFQNPYFGNVDFMPEEHMLVMVNESGTCAFDSRSGALLQTIEAGLPEKRNRNGAINNRIVLRDAGDYALAYNRDNFGPASLWSLVDGGLVRRYRFSNNAYRPFAIAPSDDAKSVYVLDGDSLYRWPGRPKDAP